MTIGIDIRALLSPHRTGVGEYTYSLLNALFTEDTKNTYVLFYNSFAEVSAVLPKWECPNVKIVGTHFPNKIFNVTTIVSGFPHVDALIEKQWNNETMGPRRKSGFPDCGLVNNLDYFFSPNPSFTSLSSRTKHILTIHDLSTELLPDCYTRKQRLWHRAVNPKRQCERAWKILTPSENTKRDVVREYGVPAEKVVVLPPGVPVRSDTRPEEVRYGVWQKYNLPERYVLFLGTIEPRKNIDGILDAFERLRSDGKMLEYGLVIAGPRGWKDKGVLKRMAETPGVRYLGYVAHEDKPVLYAGASAFVYPSLYEGFGLPVLEAMAAGVAVLTSNRSSLPEVTNGAAYLVNPYDSAEIAHGLEMILTDNAFADELRRKGRDRAGQFSWQKTARGFASLINV